jgi:hypothetical protein
MNFNIDVGAVMTFKLNSGEELIAKVVGIEGQFVKVTEPVSIAPSPQGMGLVPSMFTAEPKDDAVININSVSLYALTEESVKFKYIEATTGIKIPEKKIILG